MIKNTLIVPDGRVIRLFPSTAHDTAWRAAAEKSRQDTKNLRNARGLEEHESEAVSLLGIYIEYAVALALGIPKTDDLAVDAGQYQVKGSHYEDGVLFVPPYHLAADRMGRPIRPGTIYIFATVFFNRIVLRGWATREELLEAPFSDMGNPQRPPVRFLRQDQLHGMDTLPR